MATAKNVRLDLGPTGNAVADNMKRIRLERGMSLRDLAERLEDRGHPIAYSGLSKLENKTRRVDVDDLAAIAIALNVSPAALLVPNHADPTAAVELTGMVVTASDAWEWASGASAPLDLGPGTQSLEEASVVVLNDYPDSAMEFRRMSSPWWKRTEEQNAQRSAVVDALIAKVGLLRDAAAQDEEGR